MRDQVAADRFEWDGKYRADADLARAVTRVHAVRQLRIARVLQPLLVGAARMLEAGSGTGRIVTHLALSTGTAGYGVDYAPEANRLAQRTATALGAPVRFVQGDLTSLPFDTVAFDVVFSDGVIEHLEDAAGAVGEMARVVRAGGHVVLTTPNRLRPDGWDLYRLLRRPPYLQRSFTPWALSALCRGAGLTVTRRFGDTLLLLRNFRREGIPGPDDASVGHRWRGSGRLVRLERSAEGLLPSYLWVNLGVVCRKDRT